MTMFIFTSHVLALAVALAETMLVRSEISDQIEINYVSMTQCDFYPWPRGDILPNNKFSLIDFCNTKTDLSSLTTNDWKIHQETSACDVPSYTVLGAI